MKKSFFFIFLLQFVCAISLWGQGTWTIQNSGTNTLLHSVFFASDDTGYVTNENAILLKTTNGGTTWNMACSGPYDCLYFLDAQNGFASDGPNIIKTQDGGMSWTICYPQLNPSFYYTGIQFTDDLHGFAVGWDYYGGKFIKTINGGASWDTLYSSIYEFDCLFFIDSLTGYIGNTSGKVLKTVDGGNNWTSSVLDTLGFGYTYSIHFPTHDTGFAVQSLGPIYRTIDGGNTWNPLQTGLMSPILFSIFFTDANHGCVVGGNGINTMTLFQTHDGGDTWQMGATGTDQLYSVHFPSPNIGYTVGTNGKIYKYTGGSTNIEDVNIFSELKLFPNPTSGKLEISENNSKNAEIEITSIDGKVLLNQVLDLSHSIDISNFANGVYMIRIITDKEAITEKIIKE